MAFSPTGSYILGGSQPNEPPTQLNRTGDAFFYLRGRRQASLAAFEASETDRNEDLDADPELKGDLPAPVQSAASGSSAMKVEPDRGPVARRKRAPHEPTPEEAERRALTRVPYRDWCEAWVCGKAREKPHRRARTTTDMDEVEVDYLFFASPQHPDEKLTMLVMTLVHDGAVACSGGVKGAAPHMLKFATGTLDVWGLKDIGLKSDQEQAIIALGRAARQDAAYQCPEAQPCLGCSGGESRPRTR